EPMFNFSAGCNVPIRVRAVELYLSPWPTGVRHEIRLRVTASAPYTLQARASLRRTSGGFVHLPPSGPADQQGAPTRSIVVTPRQPGPPTATPAPPTATPAPPTATPVPPTPTPPPPTATTRPEETPDP